MRAKEVNRILGYWGIGLIGDQDCWVAALPRREPEGLRGGCWAVLIFAAMLSISSCSSKKPTDTTTQRNIDRTRHTLLVDADAGLESVIKQQQEVFGYLYDTVKLSVNYKNEAEMFDDFRHKKAAVLIMGRVLSDNEKENLKTQDTIYTQEVRVAYDAVALIANKKFDDSKLDTETLKSYFDPKSQSAVRTAIGMVFEQNSSVVKFVLGKLGFSDKVSSNVYAVKSTEEVIDYVEKNDNAIGFIPYNYLGDMQDKRVKGIFEKIKVLSLRTKNKEGKEVRASANQSDIAEGYYPLMRIINTVSLYGGEDDKARLFVDFLFKEKGARIFLKAGLIPAQTPERIINVNTGGLKRAER